MSACVDFTADDGRQNTGIVDVVIQWQGLKETADAAISGGTVCGDATAEDTTRRKVIVNSYVVGGRNYETVGTPGSAHRKLLRVFL